MQQPFENLGSLARATGIVDRLSQWGGRVAACLTLLMVLLGAYNALARWLGRSVGMSLSSNFFLELQWYVFSLIFLLGAADVLRRNGHVRVDVLYGRMSRKQKCLVDLVGTAVFLVPFAIFVLWVSWPMVHNSWSVMEASPDPDGLPRYPLKTVILLSFLLLLLQGLAEAIKRINELRRGESAPQPKDKAGAKDVGPPPEML